MKIKQLTILWLLCFLVWCSQVTNETHTDQKNQIWPTQQQFRSQGTISYHNYETERGSGDVSSDPLYTILFTPDAGSTLAQLLETKWWPKSIQLWCVKNTSLEVKAALLQANKTNNTTYSLNLEKYNQPITYQISSNLSGRIVQMTLTQPIQTFSLNQDLPDRARPGDCTADSQIIGDINITN